MKFEVQLRVLQAVGRMGADRRPVESTMLAQALNNEVSHHTAPLSHGFFVECGWLDRVGRGEYTASEVLLDYSRQLGAGIDDATSVLRHSATSGWFWRVLEPRLRHGAAAFPEVLVLLMREAEVGQAHRPQIRMLLEWLKYVRLVDLADDRVALADLSDEPEPKHRQELDEPKDRQGHGEPHDVNPPTDPLPGTTRDRSVGTVLAFDLSFELSVDDMAKLSADQIKALFEAVGTVMATKNRS